MLYILHITTLSFESVKADSLRDFGFSKDGKFKEVQVVLGLLIDCEGRPVGYELFPGNTFDGKTLEAALDKLEKRFGILKNIGLMWVLAKWSVKVRIIDWEKLN